MDQGCLYRKSGPTTFERAEKERDLMDGEVYRGRMCMPLFIVACRLFACPRATAQSATSKVPPRYRSAIPSKPKLVPEESLFERNEAPRCNFVALVSLTGIRKRGLLCSGQILSNTLIGQAASFYHFGDPAPLQKATPTLCPMCSTGPVPSCRPSIGSRRLGSYYAPTLITSYSLDYLQTTESEPVAE
jgi:hypothetical protein